MQKALFALGLFLAPAVAFGATNIGLQQPSAGMPSVTNAPLTIQLNFTNAAPEFVEASTTLTNAAISGWTMSFNQKNFTFTLTPLLDGPFSLAVPAGTFDSNPFFEISSIYDSIAPTLSFYSTTTSPTGDPIFVIATSSEAVQGLVEADFVPTNATVSNFTAASSTEFSFLLTPVTDGAVSVAVAAGAFSDLAGNTNAAVASTSFTFSNAPVAALSLLDSASTTIRASVAPGSEIRVLATYSEAIDELSTTTIRIEGPSALATTSMSRIDATHYLYIYTAGSDGTDVIVVAGAQDLAGNLQAEASTTLTIATPPPPAPAPSGGGGGGGGGGGSYLSPVSAGLNAIIPGGALPTAPAPAPAVSAEAPETQPEGEILGAQTYRFSLYLYRGMQNEEVQNLQAVLIALGLLPEDSLTGYFGPLTQKAVRAFQAGRGIAQTGTVGPQTRAALNALSEADGVLGASNYRFSDDLTLGSGGADVNELQKILIEAGFLKIKPLRPTGYYGLKTVEAVRAYQEAHGLEQTGIVDALTRAKLNR